MRLNLEGYTEQEILGYVLSGLERKRDLAVAAIADIRAQMGDAAPGKSPKRPSKGIPAVISRAPKAAKGKRELSPEARQRIADAQHKRWANVKKAKKAKGRIPLVEPETEAAEAEEMAQAG
jgi:hypothetical protein